MAGRRPERFCAIERWCATAVGSIGLREGVLDHLQGMVPFDGGFFATVDPATLLYTSAVRRHLPEEASPAFIRTELGRRDVNQLRHLATASSPVGWLDAATEGDRSSSLRYREAMGPVGLGDELRVALRIDGACWGLLCLHREDAAAGFSAKDATVLATLAPHLAEGLRRAVVVDGVVEDVTAEGPGVVMVAPDHTIEAATPTAGRWLAELAELDAPRIGRLPTVVRAVVERLNADRWGGDSLVPRARVRAPSGCWLVLHASHLDSEGEARVAVVIEPAAPAIIAPIIVAAYGLTERETEVAQRLLAGLARKAIAAELQISQHTVNDHVKAIFDKTGVSSAGQLRSHLSAEHFGPRR